MHIKYIQLFYSHQKETLFDEKRKGMCINTFMCMGVCVCVCARVRVCVCVCVCEYYIIIRSTSN